MCFLDLKQKYWIKSNVLFMLFTHSFDTIDRMFRRPSDAWTQVEQKQHFFPNQFIIHSALAPSVSLFGTSECVRFKRNIFNCHWSSEFGRASEIGVHLKLVSRARMIGNFLDVWSKSFSIWNNNSRNGLLIHLKSEIDIWPRHRRLTFPNVVAEWPTQKRFYLIVSLMH